MNPETNEADLLEQRTDLRPDDELDEEAPDPGGPEVVEADPADVQEQLTEVTDEEERRDE